MFEINGKCYDLKHINTAFGSMLDGDIYSVVCVEKPMFSLKFIDINGKYYINNIGTLTYCYMSLVKLSKNEIVKYKPIIVEIDEVIK